MKTIKLSKGKVAIVDDCDFYRLSKGSWYLHSNGHAYGRLNGKRVAMHRAIIGLQAGKECDHRNRNKLDNRRRNLRRCTRQQNQHNLPDKPNSTGYPGVSKRGCKYVAKIRMMKGRKYLGTFDTPEEASAAYEAAKASRNAAGPISTHLVSQSTQ